MGEVDGLPVPSDMGMISTPSRQPAKTLPLDLLRYCTRKRFVRCQEEETAGSGGQTLLFCKEMDLQRTESIKA